MASKALLDMLMGIEVRGGTIASNVRGEVRVAFVSRSAGSW